jgi:uncharacterized protein with ParB-like and HNH nuclease domain
MTNIHFEEKRMQVASKNVNETWDIEETEEPETEEQDVITYRISYYPADITLKGYLDKWNSKQLKIPPFQRSYVWDQVKASKLIESFLLGLPVPGIFLYKERETNKLQVIDGQQRLLSVVRFFNNEFDENIFRLKKVSPCWDGKTYKELDEADQLLLDDTVLRATVVQQLDPDDDSSIYHIFERLNTGGINLNPMEIRKCVYGGDFFTLLEELNNLPEWLKIIGKKKPDKRLRDVELILRILALSHDWKNYKKPMKTFLSNYMTAQKKTIDKLPDESKAEFINKLQKKFQKTCVYVLEQLGEQPFHLHKRLNYAVMDSTMSAAFKARRANIADLKIRYEAMLKDDGYKDAISRNTSDESTIESRFNKAMRYLTQ